MTGKVSLMRSPVDTVCGDPDCPKSLAFGTWVYYNAETQEAICIECAVKKGWTPKQRVNQLIRSLELREDIKALKRQRKIEMDALIMLKEKVDLHRLGERDGELEHRIMKTLDIVKDYLKTCGTEEEREALHKVFDVIRETQELQKEVREQVYRRLFLVEKKETRKQKKPAFAR